MVMHTYPHRTSNCMYIQKCYLPRWISSFPS